MVYRRRFVAFGTKINTIGEQDIQQKYVFSFPNPPPVPFLPSRLFIPLETENAASSNFINKQVRIGRIVLLLKLNLLP
jgi:hypothetical protein